MGMALRNGGDVGLDSGSVNMDKSETPISEAVCHPDRQKDDNGGPFKPGHEAGRIARRTIGEDH